MSSWKGENEHLRDKLSSMQQQLQEAVSTRESDAAASGEAYHSLQARQQALQSSLAKHTVCSNASQHSLQQQLQSLQSEVQAVRQERDVALAGLKALQTCDEQKKCSLHVGLSQAKEAQMQEWHAKRRHHLIMGSQIEQDAHTDVEAAVSSTDQAAASKPSSSNIQVVGKTHEQSAVSTATLAAARNAEICVMRTLQSELRRVHILERMCLSDVAEINTLHHQLHASQQSAWSLRDCMLRSSMGQTRGFAFVLVPVPHCEIIAILDQIVGLKTASQVVAHLIDNRMAGQECRLEISVKMHASAYAPWRSP
ncbi:MAG: hypothetical protein FRX49_02064 [Trebouxia sp. A1-2]|nr:MAG: hypothetical protein FRX49_02064 [Trebouxia sp. A1-2]